MQKQRRLHRRSMNAKPYEIPKPRQARPTRGRKTRLCSVWHIRVFRNAECLPASNLPLVFFPRLYPRQRSRSRQANDFTQLSPAAQQQHAKYPRPSSRATARSSHHRSRARRRISHDLNTFPRWTQLHRIRAPAELRHKLISSRRQASGRTSGKELLGFGNNEARLNVGWQQRRCRPSSLLDVHWR